MPETKETLFLVSWVIGLVSLLSVTVHCWTTRSQRQPWLVASKIALTLSILMAIPYNWDKVLQRYRLIGNVAVYTLCIGILASAFLAKSDQPTSE